MGGGWKRRRLLFAALCALFQQGLSSESADVFAEACRLLVDLFRGKKKRLDRNVSHSTIAESPTYQTIRSDPGDGDDDVLAPTTLLRRGICRKGAPLKDALAALRALLPLVCQRCARHCSDTDERSSHAASRRAARVAARCVSRLARTPWLGAPLIAAAVLPRPPPVAAFMEETDQRRHAAAVWATRRSPRNWRLRDLRTTLARSWRASARATIRWDARDIASPGSGPEARSKARSLSGRRVVDRRFVCRSGGRGGRRARVVGQGLFVSSVQSGRSPEVEEGVPEPDVVHVVTFKKEWVREVHGPGDRPRVHPGRERRAIVGGPRPTTGLLMPRMKNVGQKFCGGGTFSAALDLRRSCRRRRLPMISIRSRTTMLA